MSSIKRLLKVDTYLSNIKNPVIDVLILGASVDNRSYAVYDKFIETGKPVNRVFVLDYYKFRPKKSNTRDYTTYYKLKDIAGITYISCDNEDDDGRHLKSLLTKDNEDVYLDISSISIPDIFKICFVLKEFKGIQSLNVIYAEPKYYNYLNGLYFEFEHHIGERDYRPLNEYFTSAISRDVILVCFLGFDRLVSKYIHERKEHSNVIAINGFPAYYPKLKDISLEHNYELVSAIGYDSVRFAKANDPFAAYNLLKHIMKKNEDKLLDICVLGSKPMALGACMFALHNPEQTKISYPFPTQYRPHITLETSDMWWYQISLAHS